jgi:hypothetical protein
MRVRERPSRRAGDGAGAVALLAAGALVLGGCGGDDDGESAPTAGVETTPTVSAPPARQQPTDQGPSDEQLIRSAIEAVLASGDPAAACDQFATEAFVRMAYGDRAGCEAALASPGGAARSVEVSEIAISGESATAVAVPSGGPSSGERLEVAVVREGGTWKVDALRSNVPVGP